MTQVVVTLRTLEASVGSAFEALSKEPEFAAEVAGRRHVGGCFFVCPTDDPTPVLVIPVGDVANIDVTATARSAKELAARLVLRYRDEFAVKGDLEDGNAAAFFPYILSFHGLRGNLAAALITRTAIEAGIAKPEEATARLSALLAVTTAQAKDDRLQAFLAGGHEQV